MSVDKFGRHSYRRRALKGPRGEGFQLTNDGQYDLRNKRLCNVGNPVNPKDAVNLESLQAVPFITISGEGVIDAKSSIITNVKEPHKPSDVVTKQYMDRRFPAPYTDHWKFYSKRLSSVTDPKDQNDVVNLQYFTKHAVSRNSDKAPYDAKNARIENVGRGVNMNDAATIADLNSACQDNIKGVGTLLATHTTEIASVKDKLTLLENKNTDNFKHHEKQLKKLGTYLFKYIHSTQGRSVQLPPADEGNYLDWEIVFGSTASST